MNSNKLKTSGGFSSPLSLFAEEWRRQEAIPPETEDLVQRTARHQHPTVQESVVEKLLTTLQVQYLPRWVFRTGAETFIFDFLIEPNLVLECTLTARKGCAESKAWLKDRSTIFERKFKELKHHKPHCFTVIFLEATSCRPEDLREGIPTLQYTDRLITCLEEFEAFLTQWNRAHATEKRRSPQKTLLPHHSPKNRLLEKAPLQLTPVTGFRLRAQFYTPMTKPLGVNVPGSPTSYMVGTAPFLIETSSENKLASLAKEITEETLMRLTVKELRDLLACLHAASGDKLPKSGTKPVLVQRILASPHKTTAVQRFLADKEVTAQRKRERLDVKLFTSLRGALRHAGREILHALRLPYSMPALSEDKLPEGAHRPGECVEAEQECLLCRVFGSLSHPSLFRTYIPPLVNDPEHKLATPQEVNHVFIRTHARNVHRPDGNTLNFNQQYFAGTFVAYLTFLNGLPDPVELGFLLNCLERCDDVGAAKAWGAGKLFLQSYTLEKVERTYQRVWNGNAYQMTPKTTVTPLKAELDQACAAYTQWLAQLLATQRGTEEGAVPA